MTKETIFFEYDNKKYELVAGDGVFIPTATTKLLLDAVLDDVKAPSSILDLGCGTGIVGLVLSERGLVNGQLHASDLSKNAIKAVMQNFSNYKYTVDVREGSTFDPWVGNKYNVIIDDISGIAEKIAKKSNWFNGIPCASGDDGALLTQEVLANAPKYLTEGGRLYFPVISLSKVDKIIQCARKEFASVELIKRLEWPMPAELYADIDYLKKAAENGDIVLESKFGMYTCYTEIYRAE